MWNNLSVCCCRNGFLHLFETEMEKSSSFYYLVFFPRGKFWLWWASFYHLLEWLFWSTIGWEKRIDHHGDICNPIGEDNHQLLWVGWRLDEKERFLRFTCLYSIRSRNGRIRFTFLHLAIYGKILNIKLTEVVRLCIFISFFLLYVPLILPLRALVFCTWLLQHFDVYFFLSSMSMRDQTFSA